METYAEEVRTDERRIDFKSALGAGLVVGLLIALFPRGSPWAGLTFFSPTVMGRSMGEPGSSFMAALLPHLALSIGYAIIIGLTVERLRRFKAVLAGALVGCVLFLVNWAVFNFLVHDGVGRESVVFFTHLAFGLMCAGAYKGLSKPAVAQVIEEP
jgi:Mg/Co/Ni transporter MgtE